MLVVPCHMVPVNPAEPPCGLPLPALRATLWSRCGLLRLPGHWSRGGWGLAEGLGGWGWARLPALGAGGRKPSSEICGILVSRDTIRSMAGTKLCVCRVDPRGNVPIFRAENSEPPSANVRKRVNSVWFTSRSGSAEPRVVRGRGENVRFM